MATITTTNQHQRTILGFPLWSLVVVATIVAAAATVLVVRSRAATVEPAVQAASQRYEGLAEHWEQVELESAAQRAQAADTARWEAVYEAYRFERSNQAASDRLAAQAGAYGGPEAARQAAADRLTGLAVHHGAIDPGLQAWADRYEALADDHGK